jgi:uncharacterized protein YecT (DUF1311 family)
VKFVLVLALMPFAALAEDATCAADATQSDLNICASEKALAADARMLDVLALNLAHLREISPEAEAAQSQAQDAFVTYREGTCLARGALLTGGSIAPMVRSDCFVELTERRIEDLCMSAGTLMVGDEEGCDLEED